MSNWTLNDAMQIEIVARLIGKGNDAPLHGPGYHVRLFDREFFEDEYLGEDEPDEKGKVRFLIPSGNFKHHAIDDNRPDFFFVVYFANNVLFISKVMENVYLEGVESYRKGEGLVVDLGSFLIDTNMHS